MNKKIFSDNILKDEINEFSRNEKKLKKLDGKYLGYVIDNEDPLKMGRCKIKIFSLFDNLEKDEIPWAFPLHSNKFADSENGGFGSFSFPKLNTLVVVEFAEGDRYSPQYTFVEKMNTTMQNEISDSYINSQVIVYDVDENMKILYTQKQGLLIWMKESFVNIDPNTDIHIVHSGKESTVRLFNKEIISKATDKIEETSKQITNNASKQHYINTPDAKVGHAASHPDTKCDILFQLLKQMAIDLDARVPVTPGKNLSLVKSFEQMVCSKIVTIA